MCMIVSSRGCGKFVELWRDRLAVRREAWGLGVVDGVGAGTLWRNEAWRRAVGARESCSRWDEVTLALDGAGGLEDGISAALKMWRGGSALVRVAGGEFLVAFTPARCPRCSSGCTVLVARLERFTAGSGVACAWRN